MSIDFKFLDESKLSKHTDGLGFAVIETTDKEKSRYGWHISKEELLNLRDKVDEFLKELQK